MRYEILAQLGKGGMGEVFLSRMHRPGTPPHLVALKRLRPELANDPQARARFRREARTSSLLVHPNLVALEDWGVDRSGPYLALEYVEGRTASAVLKALGAQALAVEVALGLALDVARGLLHAHQGVAGTAVIHRDVSLDNILVSREGVAKLGDFGIARVTGETELTRTGAIQGKVGSIAPELFEGGAATPAVDVFAFGVALHALLCGVAPFFGDTDAAVMRAVLYASPPSLRALRPEVPEAVDALVHACLSKSVADRPVMEAVVAGLEEHVQGDAWREGLSEAVARTPVSAPRQLTGTRSVVFQPAGRRRWPLWLGAVVVMAVAGVGLLARRPKVPPPAVVPSRVEVVTPVEVVPRVETVPVVVPGPRPRPVAKARPAKGKLSVKVSPWGYVFVDGELRGMTPLRPLLLSPGRHAILVVNADLGARKTFQVDIRAGAERTLHVKME